MKNPIFDSTTIFTEQAPDGTVRRLSAHGNREFSCGARLVVLSTAQALMEIKTERGNELIIAPEAVFALAKDDEGCPVRYHPVHKVSSQDLTAVDFNADFDSEAIRFMFAGMIVARGNHLFDRFRASSLIIPASIAAPAEAFLQRMGNAWQSAGVMHPKSNRVTLIEHEEGYFLRSRILTRFIGNLLKDNTQEPLFYPDMVPDVCTWAFMRGLLSTAYREDGQIIFRHRHASVVRSLYDVLWSRFGVTATLCIDPMEPEIQQNSMVPKAHQFRLSAEDQRLAVTAGLIDGEESGAPSQVSDAIVSVTPFKTRRNAVIVVPGNGRDTPIMANGFVFSPQFNIPHEAEFLATHPVLLDSSDPAAL